MKIYLAAPYSHPKEDMRLWRSCAAAQTAAKLMQAGHIVYAPTVYGHEVARFLPASLALDHAFWMRQDLPMLTEWADIMMVLTIPGWQTSRGIAEEMKAAREKGIVVAHIEMPREEEP